MLEAPYLHHGSQVRVMLPRPPVPLMPMLLAAQGAEPQEPHARHVVANLWLSETSLNPSDKSFVLA